MSNTYKLDGLTIVVPSYNRQGLLLRLMRYWSGKSAILLVLDGSDFPLEARVLSELESNVRYIHHPVGLYARLKQAATLVETEFVMMGTDDDFFVPSALEACIKELKENTRLISCGGLAVGFGFGFENAVYLRKVYPNLKNHALLSEIAYERTAKHFSNYEPAHIYSIQRAESWMKLAEGIFSREFGFFAAWELQFEFLLPYLGPTKIINNLLWMRGFEVEPIRGTSASMSLDNDIYGWWKDPKYKSDKEQFISHMNNIYFEITGKKYYNFKQDICNSIELFISTNFSANTQTIKSSLKKITPQFMWIFLRNNITKLKWFNPQFNPGFNSHIPTAFTEMTQSGIEFDAHEIDDLLQHIEKYHLQKNNIKNNKHH